MRVQLFFATATAILLSAGLVLGQDGHSTPPHAPSLSFSNYLRTSPRRPSLVAYSPTCYNPDKPLPSEADLAVCINQDLQTLRPLFDGLITYSYIPRLTDLVMHEAVLLGYRAVLLGIWDPRSDVEISGIANELLEHNQEMALAVVIGNEGLNDNRYSLKDLQVAARRLKESSLTLSVPVTTSEPTSGYSNKGLQAFGDFLAPNIHPAIDEPNLSPSDAARWVARRAQDLATIARKDVLVKESGLPNGGLPIFSPIGQRDFWCNYGSHTKDVQNLSQSQIFLSAVFEAFDTPWKVHRTGEAIEGHWGILGADRGAHPAFTALESGCSDPPPPPPPPLLACDYNPLLNSAVADGGLMAWSYCTFQNPVNFNKGQIIYIDIDPTNTPIGTYVLVRLVPEGCPVATPCRQVFKGPIPFLGPGTSPSNILALPIKMPRDYRSITQISVHSGQIAFGQRLNKSRNYVADVIDFR